MAAASHERLRTDIREVQAKLGITPKVRRGDPPVEATQQPLHGTMEVSMAADVPQNVGSGTSSAPPPTGQVTAAANPPPPPPKRPSNSRPPQPPPQPPTPPSPHRNDFAELEVAEPPPPPPAAPPASRQQAKAAADKVLRERLAKEAAAKGKQI